MIDYNRQFFSTFSRYPGGFPLYGTIRHLYCIDWCSFGLHRWHNVSLVKGITSNRRLNSRDKSKSHIKSFNLKIFMQIENLIIAID